MFYEFFFSAKVTLYPRCPGYIYLSSLWQKYYEKIAWDHNTEFDEKAEVVLPSYKVSFQWSTE